MTEKLTQIKVI